jgi:hypothetical protein
VKLMLELMVWMMIVGLVVAAFVLIAMAIGAACLGAVLWLFLSAAHDRLVASSTGVGYWRWWADRFQQLFVALDRERDESALGESMRRRTIARLEAQTDRLARRIDRGRSDRGVVKDWTRRQDEQRLDELRVRLDRQREGLLGRPSPPEDHHRVGGDDREATVAALSHAHDEGRLDSTELEERIGRAYEAVTYTELEELIADLGDEAVEPGRRRNGQRASDRDREGAVAVLRTALDEGRLSPEEFSERAERAYGARYEEEIAGVVEDLPDSYVMRTHWPKGLNGSRP